MDPLSPTQPNAAPQPITPEGGQVLPTPEISPPAAAEKAPMAPSEPVTPVVTPPLTGGISVPVADPMPAPQTTTSASPVMGPAVAGDVDVIEKEWVEKAEEIVEAHKEDPYTEEEAVEDLQIDYLKKRYGKEIHKSTSDGQPSLSTNNNEQLPGGGQNSINNGS